MPKNLDNILIHSIILLLWSNHGTHAMIDIETLGTGANCVVLTVGAVKFDPGIAKNQWIFGKIRC